MLNLELIEAAKKGDTKKVIQCLTNGADIEYKDKDGYTSLMYASENGHLKTVEKLIELNANVNVESSVPLLSSTPLSCALHKGKTNVAELLIKSGANVNATTSLPRPGTSCLLLCVHHNLQDIAKLLIEHGAKIGISDINGETPLMQAVRNQNLAMIEILFENRNRKEILMLLARPNINGQNAFDIARSLNDKNMITFFARKTIDDTVREQFQARVRSMFQRVTEAFVSGKMSDEPLYSSRTLISSSSASSSSSFSSSSASTSSSSSSTQEENPPARFFCPISYEIMENPYFCTLDSRTYDYKNIVKWLEKHGRSPFTQTPLGNKKLDKVLFPVYELKTEIEEFTSNLSKGKKRKITEIDLTCSDTEDETKKDKKRKLG